MNFMSLNIRGFGDARKRDWILSLRRLHKFSFIGIQESQLEDPVNRELIKDCWGDINFDYDFMNANGRSGGLISIWDKSMFNSSEVIKSNSFLIIFGSCSLFSNLFAIVNVYGPQSPSEKRKLWEELLKIKNSRTACWIFFGDFNVVRAAEERINSTFCHSSANHFNNFIEAAGLKELKMGGFRFTYFQRAGAKLSKLDRFLICPEFYNLFPQATVTVLPREKSDHSPILLSHSDVNFGAIPFKLFNSWMVRNGFDEVIIKACSNFVGFGNPDSRLLNKLKAIKKAIREWRSVEFSKENAELLKLKEARNNIDKKLENGGLCDGELEERNIISCKIDELERVSLIDLKQKARIKWLIDGDENSRFFHGYVANRIRKNHIHGVLINGDWKTSPGDMKVEIARFFANKFSEKWPSRPKFQSSKFKTISDASRDFLEGLFSVDEIKKAIWSCGSDKAPGPDGFSFKFLKRFWSLLKEDIVGCIRHFETFGTISRGCNASFITLVAKTKDPLILGDYRPISLIGSIYKIISKLLASRLKLVIGECIDEVQSAFVADRYILEGPLIVNEVCSWGKAKKKKLLIFKADFNKAFDSLNWGFLDSLMMQMNFGDKWRKWINGCLTSTRASVIVNGSPTCEFSLQKGVRQGDPLSPFLFIIAMEGLNIAMKEAIDNGIFRGIQIANEGSVLSHLFYADDALFLGEWSKDNIDNLARILRCFYVSSGLQVNFNKSKVVGIGVNDREVEYGAGPLGCEPTSLPFMYLGVPVGANMNSIKHWRPIIEKFKAKLSIWKAKNLSFGGRVTLAKAVLANLPNYFLSLFAAPNAVINSLERIRRNFIWGGEGESQKINWVAWDRIIAPREVGGLGLGSIKALNIALLAKWWWKLKNSPNSLWSKIINGIHYGAGANDDNITARKSFPGVWNNIVRCKKDLRKINIEVRDVIRRAQDGEAWESDFAKDGFSVAALRIRIDRSPHFVSDGIFPWIKWVPFKVLCFVWRARLSRIPSAVALIRRNVRLDSPWCGGCVAGIENSDHLLVGCPYAVRVWICIMAWCGLEDFNSVTVKDLIDFAAGIKLGSKLKKKALISIVFGTLWALWRNRNERIFNGVVNATFKVVDAIKSMTYFWIKHRFGKTGIDWVDWSNSPLTCL